MQHSGGCFKSSHGTKENRIFRDSDVNSELSTPAPAASVRASGELPAPEFLTPGPAGSPRPEALEGVLVEAVDEVVGGRGADLAPAADALRDLASCRTSKARTYRQSGETSKEIPRHSP